MLEIALPRLNIKSSCTLQQNISSMLELAGFGKKKGTRGARLGRRENSREN